jgi:hypothetical protein
MPLYVQVDAGIVTGTLYSAGEIDVARLPNTRRMLVMDVESTPPVGGSTVVINPDDGAKVRPVDGAVTFTPPVPVVPTPTPLEAKLEEILTEVKKVSDVKPVP